MASTTYSLGPVLRTEEGEDGAVLCNDQESLCGASRENSLADCGITIIEASQCREEANGGCSALRPARVGTHLLAARSAGAPAAAPAAWPVSEPAPAPAPTVAPMAEEPAGRPDGSRTPSASCSDLERECESEGDAGARSDDEAFSDIGDPGATEVVFVKEGVAVCPTKDQRIMGRLSLIRQHHVLFLAWLPYSQGLLGQDGTFQLSDSPRSAARGLRGAERAATQYAVHPIPLSEVKSVRKHTPTFGTPHVVLVLVGGLTLPPLHFLHGGVKELFSALKLADVRLAKSADDASLYLVNDTADPFQRTLTSLDLGDVLRGAPPPGAAATFAPYAGAGSSGLQQWAGELDGAGRAPLLATVAEQCQRMAALARETTSSWLASSHLLLAPVGGPACAPLAGGAGGACGVSPVAGTGGGAGPAGPARAPASPPAGEQPMLSSGEPGALAERRASGGEAGSTDTGVGVFELLERQGLDAVAAARAFLRGPPLAEDEFATYLDVEGRLVDVRGFRERVFRSGCDPHARVRIWPLLLGVYPEGASQAERDARAVQLKEEYERIKAQWTSIMPAQAARFAKWRERRNRVDKDVRRTDRAHPFFAGGGNRHVRALRSILLTYAMYNFDLSYCQGMSDLAAPLLYVMRDEAAAFWCFAALMERLAPNFHTDCTGMHAQLGALRGLVQLVDPALHAHFGVQDCLSYFFCYRWLLIHFKREFAFDEVLRLWEALWSRHLGDHFHVYACAAVLCHHRRAILGARLDFDGLLRFCVELAGRIDLDQTLRDAEALVRLAGEAGRDCMASLPSWPHPSALPTF